MAKPCWRMASSSHIHVCDKSAECWDLCKTLRLGEKPLRRKRQSIAHPKTHEREHPIRHPVLGSYPSSAILPLSPGERVPLAHRGKQCLANRLQDHTACYASGWWILLVCTPWHDPPYNNNNCNNNYNINSNNNFI